MLLICISDEPKFEFTRKPDSRVQSQNVLLALLMLDRVKIYDSKFMIILRNLHQRLSFPAGIHEPARSGSYPEIQRPDGYHLPL